DRFRVGGFDLFGKPVPFDSVQHNYGEENEKEQHDADLFEIADDGRNSSAKEITKSREYHYPKPAAYGVQHDKAEKRHFTYAVKNAHRQAYAVYIFRNDEGEASEFIDQPFDPRLRYAVIAIVLRILMKKPAHSVTEQVAGHSAERSGKE